MHLHIRKFLIILPHVHTHLTQTERNFEAKDDNREEDEHEAEQNDWSAHFEVVPAMNPTGHSTRLAEASLHISRSTIRTKRNDEEAEGEGERGQREGMKMFLSFVLSVRLSCRLVGFVLS